MARAEADDQDAQVVEVAEERRGADERVEVLRVTDVAGVHDDEAVVEVVLARPLVVARLRRDRGRVDPVRDHREPLGGRPLLLEPLAASSRRSRRPGRRGGGRADERASRRDRDRVLEPPELDRDLGEDVLAITSSGASNRRATASPMSPTIGGSVMQSTTSGGGPRSARHERCRARYVT